MKKYFFLFFLVIISKNFATNLDLQDQYFFYLKSFEYHKAREIANKLNDTIQKKEAISLLNVLYDHEYDENTYSNTINSKVGFLSLLRNLKYGYIDLFHNPYSVKSFEYFNKALLISKSLKYTEAYKFSIVSIFLFYSRQVEQTNKEHFKLLNQFKNIINDKEDKFHYYINTLYYNLRKISRNHSIESSFLIDFNKVMLTFNEDHPFWVNYYSTLGVYFRLEKNNKAEEYLSKSLRLVKFPFQKHLSLRGNIQLSHIYRSKKKYDEALKFLHKAERFIDKKDSLKLTYFLNLYKANVLKDKGNYESAYKLLNLSVKQKDQLDYLKNNIEVSNLNIKYKTAEKEKQILESEAKRKQNLLLLIVVSLLLVLGTVIYILSFQNSKRKQKLAEQQKELEKQKNLTLIKEQEITTINAMVEGQEKERRRVAEDLHDNLGSVLATLKLHFENLKINREKKKIDHETLFSKTENLIDEAYLKVRKIAHAKNAGVIANQGLLLAVQTMAEKISAADKIQIDVVDYGLEKRLENNLEISIFRIIQELTTNIMKHAEANHATINISAYDKNLNIIIEDNGKGFDVEKVDYNNGMGLSSIKTRVKYLKGTFEVDSTLHKGTSIIIDIPIG